MEVYILSGVSNKKILKVAEYIKMYCQLLKILLKCCQKMTLNDFKFITNISKWSKCCLKVQLKVRVSWELVFFS